MLTCGMHFFYYIVQYSKKRTSQYWSTLQLDVPYKQKRALPQLKIKSDKDLNESSL